MNKLEMEQRINNDNRKISKLQAKIANQAAMINKLQISRADLRANNTKLKDKLTGANLVATLFFIAVLILVFS